MKTQNFGRGPGLPLHYALWDHSFHNLPLAVSSLKDYREKRENGDQRDAPRAAFPAAGFDALDIQSSDWQGSSKWPDQEGRFWCMLTCKGGREINDYYWKKDEVRGYPDKADGNRYWFSVHHAPSGTKIEGFSARPDREKGYPDKDGDYWYYIQYDECGPIKTWMEEKDRNYVARLQRLEEARLAAEKTALEQARLLLEEQRRQFEEEQAASRRATLEEREQTLVYADLEFTRSIAEGSFGKVFLGKWMGTPVAIKKPHKNEDDAALRALNETYLQSLRAEASMMAKLNHPNVVKLYGIVTEPEFCIIMELMTKGALYDLLQSSRPLDWSFRQRIAADIAQGLHYLHRSNVLHRDLKSPNILLDNDYRAKLSDYGASKYGASYSTQSLYSPFWLAPELLFLMINPGSQVRVDYTRACDVYSFAMVLWELASRKEPKYISPRDLTMGRRQEIPADTPQSMVALITRCWDRKPESRPLMNTVVQEIQATVMADDYTPQPFTPSVGSGSGDGRRSRGSPSYFSGSSSSLASSSMGSHQPDSGSPMRMMSTSPALPQYPQTNLSTVPLQHTRSSAPGPAPLPRASDISAAGRGFFSPPSTPGSAYDYNAPPPPDDEDDVLEAQVTANYRARAEQELTVVKGNIVFVLEQKPSGWWLCKLNEKQGLVPGNRLQLVDSVPQLPPHY